MDAPDTPVSGRRTKARPLQRTNGQLINSQQISAHWNGVRMRKVRAGADPDAATRLVTLPADWDDDAAAALAQLAPGQANVSLAQAAARWIQAIAGVPASQEADAGTTITDSGLAERLNQLLLYRVAAPNQAVWQASRTETPAFVINLAAFAQAPAGFDVDALEAAVRNVAEALRRQAGITGKSGRILLGNLDACLAGLGLDYDSDAARDMAACLFALATASAHPDRAPRQGLRRQPPAQCPVPQLAARAQAAWHHAAAHTAGTDSELFPEPDQVETGLSMPGPADALLGFEACGVAPIFSPLRSDGRLATSTLARLAARGTSPEAALAASLAGAPVLRMADFASVQAMHRAISPFIDRMPVPALSSDGADAGRRVAAGHPDLPTPSRRELPARHGGFTQKASVGGHRMFLRTGEYRDGSLGELSISPVRDGPAQRGLMEAFSQAVSIGLQHGVPLEAYVDAFAYMRFGPNGAVEGDASVASATSLLDYAFRTLAQTYLGCVLPDAPQAQPDHEIPEDQAEALLPLDLPRASNVGIRQRHGLRLVG